MSALTIFQITGSLGARLASVGIVLAAGAVDPPNPGQVRSDKGGDDSQQSEPYADRLIDGGQLPTLAVKDDSQSSNAKGNVRSLMVELSGSNISPKTRINGVDATGIDRVLEEQGISVSARYQTDNFGMLGLDGELRRGHANSPLGSKAANVVSGSATFTDRGLPLGNGWLADGALGVVSAPAIPLVRRQTRFYFPTMPLLGGAVTLKSYDRLAKISGTSDPEPVASLNVAVGEPGLLGGIRLSDFTGLSGIAVSAGGQIELASNLTAGIQAFAVQNTRDPYSVVLANAASTGSAATKASSQSALATASFASGAFRLLANAIWSHRSGFTGPGSTASATSSATGGWIEASFRSGRTAQSGGVYYFAPDLTWGTSAIVNNVYGGYYRISSSSQRWRWTLNLDGVKSVNGRSTSGVIANGDLRRQLSFSSDIGVNSSVRIANGQTASQFLTYVDFSSKLGSTRAEAGWSHDPASDLFHLGWNQNWSLPVWLPAGSRLSTQFALDQRRQAEDSASATGGTVRTRTNSFGAAISAGASPFNGISLDATVAFNTNGGSSSTSIYGPVDATGGALGLLSSQQGRAFSANVAVTARLSSKWSLLASFTDTTSNLSTRYGLPGLATSPLGFTPVELAAAQNSTFRLRAGYLTLRYSNSAGRLHGTIGRHEYPVGGSGVLAGRVYLDANANHTREPSEAGVPGIVVILDGIMAVKTDQYGYYHFDDVADGPHRVTVNADELPLPWSITPSEGTEAAQIYSANVEIRVRDTTKLDIAASRE